MPPSSRSELEALSLTDVRYPINEAQLWPILQSPPFIASRSLINIRDAGAVPGSALPVGRFFRCGTLEFAAKDPDAVAWLSSNVRRIFDLRKAEERLKGPSPDMAGVENVWLEQQGEYRVPNMADFAQGDGAPAWGEQYMDILKTYKPTIKAILEHVRDRPTEPILFHCTAGRDRTGVVSGLLQALAGTPPEDVTFDFMLSRIGTEPAREKLVSYAMATVGTTDWETPGFLNLASLRPAFWAAFVQDLNEAFGDWDGYVTQGLGFSHKDLAAIKNNLRS